MLCVRLYVFHVALVYVLICVFTVAGALKCCICPCVCESLCPALGHLKVVYHYDYILNTAFGIVSVASSVY